MEVLKQISELVDKVDINKSPNPKSISAGAAKSTYYFPIVCSKTVDPSTASMISSNLESAYTSFVKACFAMVPAMAVKGDILNIEEYLKLFHQNIGIKNTNDLFVSLKESIEEWTMYPNETLNEATLSNVKNIIDRSGYKGINDAIDNKVTKLNGIEVNENTKWNSVKEVEKKNAIRASLVNVDATFIIKNKEVKCTIPVGVKTIIHPVDTNDLVDQIMDSVAGRGIIHNLIRYTTGEMLSLKDILFGVSRMKKNVSNKSDISKWMDVLDHRKRLSKLSLPFLGKKAFLPNVSINISMDDVETIKRIVGYDLLKEKSRAAKFIKDNFLLALVITDDATETAYIMYDGHSSYEEYPYKTLKRENEKTSDAIDSMIKGLSVGVRL